MSHYENQPQVGGLTGPRYPFVPRFFRFWANIAIRWYNTMIGLANSDESFPPLLCFGSIYMLSSGEPYTFLSENTTLAANRVIHEDQLDQFSSLYSSFRNPADLIGAAISFQTDGKGLSRAYDLEQLKEIHEPENEEEYIRHGAFFGLYTIPKDPAATPFDSITWAVKHPFTKVPEVLHPKNAWLFACYRDQCSPECMEAMIFDNTSLYFLPQSVLPLHHFYQVLLEVPMEPISQTPEVSENE